MSGKANPKTVGLFVVGALLLAAASLVMFGSGQLFAKTYPFMIFFDGSVAGLSVGAPVKYRGVEIGVVKEVNIAILSQDFGDVRMPVVVELNQRKIQKRTPNDIDLGNPAYLDTLVQAGFRASLATQSLVTGTKYVALDVYPNAAPLEDYPESPHYVIPVQPSALEGLEGEIAAFVDRLTDVDPGALMASIAGVVEGLDSVVSKTLPELLEGLPATIENLNATMNAIQGIAAGLDSTIGPMRAELLRSVSEVTSTMDEVEATLVSIRALTEPESPLIIQLEETLANLSDASLGVARLVDYLERDPSALIRGKSKEGGN
jgi:phospholipid/cholesterol/gamma-HCH transport system substrate-binding protein